MKSFLFSIIIAAVGSLIVSCSLLLELETLKDRIDTLENHSHFRSCVDMEVRE